MRLGSARSQPPGCHHPCRKGFRMPDLAFATRPTTRSGRNPAKEASLRNILKEATARDHARLDGRLGAFDLHDSAGYRRFLEANAAALLPLEGALVAAG